MKVIRDPFSCRNDLNVWAQYKALKSLSPLTLKDSDRILLEKLGSDRQAFINETPHLFINSIFSNTILFKPPNAFILNPKDYKCGDLVELDNSSLIKKIIECKTFEKLTNSKAAQIYTQYQLSQNVDLINFSILYSKDVISEKEFTRILCANSKIDPNKLKFINLENLEGLITESNIERFFSFYKKVSYQEYSTRLSLVRDLLFDEVSKTTNDLSIKKSLEKHRERLIRVETKNYSILKKSKVRGLVSRDDEKDNSTAVVEFSDNNFSGGE